MTLVVGTDEAGYGPNLGPLVVAATAWEVAAAADDVDGVFTAVAADLAGLWGDSKQIFRGGAGLSALERGVLAAAGWAVQQLVVPRLRAMVDSWQMARREAEEARNKVRQ